MTDEEDKNINFKNKMGIIPEEYNKNAVQGRAKTGEWQSKYDTRYDDMLVDHLAEGGTKKSFAGMIGVSRGTLDLWSKKHPSFGLAYKHGKEKSYLWWLRLGRDLAMGEKKGNGIVYNFIMANLFGWHNKHELEKKQDTGVSIQFIRAAHQASIEAESNPKIEQREEDE